MERPLLSRLFGGEVATCEVWLDAPTDELWPEERAQTDSFVAVRLAEYRAGRHCARACMRRLGVAEGPVLRAPDRAPIWPAGVVGSISHTRRDEVGWCGAAVARSDAVRALGIDGEAADDLDEQLWRLVLAPAEVTWLRTLPESERGRWAKLIFSAKEAAYKCQYTLTRTFLGFEAFVVRFDPERGTFAATFQQDVGEFRRGQVLHGGFIVAERLVVTALQWPPAPAHVPTELHPERHAP